MRDTEKQPNIEFEGKIFRFLIFFGKGSIYGWNDIRLIVDADGSIYGSYWAKGKPKGVKIHIPVI